MNSSPSEDPKRHLQFALAHTYIDVSMEVLGCLDFQKEGWCLFLAGRSVLGHDG